MVENFRNLSGRVRLWRTSRLPVCIDAAKRPPVCTSCQVSLQDQTEPSPRAIRSLLLLSERDSRHVTGLLHYLGRTDAALPPELLRFAEGVSAAREDQKVNRPLCSYLKTLGRCR